MKPFEKNNILQNQNISVYILKKNVEECLNEINETIRYQEYEIQVNNHSSVF